MKRLVADAVSLVTLRTLDGVMVDQSPHVMCFWPLEANSCANELCEADQVAGDAALTADLVRSLWVYRMRLSGNFSVSVDSANGFHMG